MEHLTYFKVENFKRFKSFELDDIGQFNLIVGDNNVGKTSVLEALLIDENTQVFSKRLATLIYEVKKFTESDYDYIQYFVNKSSEDLILIFKYKINGVFTTITLKQIDKTDKWSIQHIEVPHINNNLLEGNELQLYSDEDTIYLPYVYLNAGYDNDLINYYSFVQESRNLKRHLINSLKVLIPNIEDIEISIKSSPTLLVAQKDMDAVIPLAIFGEGSIKLFRILCQIILSQEKRLMIDEIDAGIHFSRMKLFWKTILNAAKDNKVQLFVTTHNEECLRYFKEALEEEDMQELQKNARCFTLQEVKDGNVKAYKTGFEGFQHAIDMHINIRGGKVYG